MLISIVVPVFNEEDNIDNFYREVVKNMQDLAYTFEIIFVDDGSRDATPLILDRLANCDNRVRALVLARNFGHQIALTCGLDHADGDAVITMDGDMQHPPSMLPLLIKQWEEGYEVVQTIRTSTEGVSWFKKLTSRLYYKLINSVSNVHINEGGSDFRLLDKTVVTSFRRFRERARFIRGMISAIGYKQILIEFTAPPRYAGTTKFSLKGMLHFALDGITAYSKLPLRIAFYIGVLCALGSFILALHVLYIKVFTQQAAPGWATITASILMLGGLQLAGLGVIGEYVGRIFEEVKQRPLYWLRVDEAQPGRSKKKEDLS
ncbi:glycosyltransferase family 2 protein [Anaerospora sp.]|jgi:dolichol-phosphate mannosyltransferase|uniref:glycosyltransferase family 2 protein n=1 Tax=Anaerospora sp. TaxID=1960278 RepID=UPI00289C36FB|nr:glycosyltransferase family 2 protein [Anaerospora sp.]